MRVKRGASIEETLAELTKDQLTLLERARQAKDSEPDRLAHQRQVLKMRVHDALEAGVPHTVVADTLGVTRPRVYQLNTEAERFESSA